jgi:uncharacterized lipoprotein YmbA
MIACIAAVNLGACQSSPTRIHGLDLAVPATRMETYQAPPLRVDTVNVPASWDRIEMLDLSAPGRLGINEFDHWSAPLAQITRQALSGDLDRRLPPGSVIYPRLPKPNGALGVDVDILDFAVKGSQASMQASWTIVPATGSQSAKRSVALLQSAMTSTEPAAIARAWSELLGQLADHIASDTASFNE